MTYVDEVRTHPTDGMSAQTKRNGSEWSHLTADTLTELHSMARVIGLQRRWFQDHGLHPHYDITPGKRQLALSRGAQFKPARQQAQERMDARRKANELSDGLGGLIDDVTEDRS